MTFTKKDWTLVDELAAAKKENRRLKHIEVSIEALFDLGQGHTAGSIEITESLWKTILNAANRRRTENADQEAPQAHDRRLDAPTTIGTETMPKVNRGEKVTVKLSALEVRTAIEHAAWCAAVDDDPSIAVNGEVEITPIGNGGYSVRYTPLQR